MDDLERLAERSRQLLADARFMTLATGDGVFPWASTVNYVALWAPLRLLYYSLRTARHSRNVAHHPRVSGSIFLTGLPGFGLDGAQFTGTCRAVGPRAVAEYHRHYYLLNFPDEEVRRRWLLPEAEFRGAGPRRFYTVEVERWWLLDIDRWLIDKHDRRIAVPLQALTTTA
ncbi:pyridoxamine 5'-phosphate oxidase family protein [Streptomyces celluloflavus]|uniref:pyridoxamine 5'-phosphate oxidase family protein n=1 Tax=Streptomyces celluloflavus TaxID=58344 RepID=UPI003460F865|nr:pyridoxamine 5'-phosphate oxidase family protein [Streptomyces celluloflavus]